MNKKIENFRDLNIWQNGKEIVKAVYEITKRSPDYELYGLTAQMRRAAVSIPSNVAEGFYRYHDKEYIQFLRIALGSCGELETQIEIAFDLKYIDETERQKLVEMIISECKMLKSLLNKLEQKNQNSKC